MNIILCGPQGSGKGTQARLLSEKYGFFYFESGAYLRRIADKHPELKAVMDSGRLVPDKEMTSYLTAFLDQEHLYDDVIFDGFPRTLDQYNFLKNWLIDKNVKIDLCIVLEIPKEETIKRLSARRQDPKTAKIYNLITDLPPADVDLNTLIQRDDDKPESIEKRLELYHTRTEILIEELVKDTKVVRLDGQKSISDIHNEIVAVVESSR